MQSRDNQALSFKKRAPECDKDAQAAKENKGDGDRVRVVRRRDCEDAEAAADERDHFLIELRSLFRQLSLVHFDPAPRAQRTVVLVRGLHLGPDERKRHEVLGFPAQHFTLRPNRFFSLLPIWEETDYFVYTTVFVIFTDNEYLCFVFTHLNWFR